MKLIFLVQVNLFFRIVLYRTLPVKSEG